MFIRYGSLLFGVLIGCLLSQAQRKIVMPDGNSLFVDVVKADKQGRFIYSAEAKKCVMWDLKTGRQLHTFRYNGGDKVDGMDISPDGNQLLIVANGQLTLFNTITGERAAGMDSYVYNAVYSADGNQLYVIKHGLDVVDVRNLAEKSHVQRSFSNGSKIWLLPENKVLLANANRYEIHEPSTGKIIFSHEFPNASNYLRITYLPLQQLLVCYGRDIPIDFYDINTATKKGSIPGKSYDDPVIPSVNSNEILVQGPQVSEGFNGMDLYSTESFKLAARLTNTDVVKYHATSDGYFDGKAKKAWLINYNKIVEYDMPSKKRARVLEGYAAFLGMDVFNSLQYNYANGRMHINTDDHNLKTIDLFRMVPVLHTDLKADMQSLSVSATGDTVAIFDGDKLVVKNVATNKIIRAAAPAPGVGFLENGCFFFSNDGKSFFYPLDGKEKKSLLRVNMATGIKETVFTVKGFGPVVVHPDHTMLAGFESAYEVNNAAVWDLKTGKKIFTANMDTDGKYDEQYASLSYDKKKLLVVRPQVFKVFDIATGGILVDKKFTGYADKFGACAASSDLSVFITGSSSGDIVVYNSDGDRTYDLKAHTSTIRRILFSPDDQLFYTVSNDNTIKVWETTTGRFIGVLYLFRDSNDFVFMDQDGRFDGTPEGIKKVYYVLNKKIMPLDALFEIYYTPNLYQRSVNKEKFVAIDVNIKPAPVVKISYASAARNLEVDDAMPTYQNTTGAADITITASTEDDSVDEIRLFHNGKIITLTTRNLIVTDDKNNNSTTKKYSLALLPGQNSIRAIALNTQRTESDPDEISVIYKAANVAQTVIQPVNNNAALATVDKTATMHLVVVGINAYKNPAMSLNYALADATAFKDEMEKDAKTVITTVKTYFVKDNEADKAGIINAFAEVKKNARPQDIFIFYYAGHGVIGKDKEFYLVPNDVSNLNNVQEELNQKGIPSRLLQQYAIDIQAQKQLFILDACQSAGAFETLMANDGNQQKSLAVVARSTGTHWMAASGAQQFANEFASLGHGAFTYVLLEALKGKASNNKMITVNGLKGFLQVQVPELMKKYNGSAQYPASYGYGNDFPVQLIK